MDLRVMLVGCPNSGKTTLFNALTGRREQTGNRAGVTVGAKYGKIKNTNFTLYDLPGTYSLHPFTDEEKVTVSALKSAPSVTVAVIDGLRFERGLYLVLSLLKCGKKPIIYLSMLEKAQKNGITINAEALAKITGLTVTTTPEELVSAIKQRKNINEDLLSESVIDEKEVYRKIAEITAKTVQKSNKRSVTDKIDNVILRPYVGLPLFFAVAFLTFFLVFKGGEAINLLFRSGLSFLSRVIKNSSFAPVLKSLLADGILGGIGSVLSFLPQLFILFFLSAVTEASGYLARVSASFDKFFTYFSLSGKSAIPLILGTGCSVPAIMSLKTIKEKSLKECTATLIPFIPCSAKLPIIALFAGFFFKENAAFAALGFYLLSILIVIALAFFTRAKQKERFSLTELPDYSIPSFKEISNDTLSRTLSFIKKTGTVIFICSVLVWFLSSFSIKFAFDCRAEESILALIGKALSFILYPVVGELSWAATISALLGFVAKEQVVSSMAIIAGSEAEIFSSPAFSFFTPSSAVAFVVFNLFSSPCIAAVSALSKELGGKKALSQVFFQTLFALVLSSAFHLIFLLSSY
mgnify:CR=1 FL=1